MLGIPPLRRRPPGPMSNYLFIIADDRAAGDVRRWLAARGADPVAEMGQVDLANRCTLFVLAANVRSTFDPELGIFFRGYAIDYDRQEITFGLPGFRDAGPELRGSIETGTEGEYVLARVSDDAVSFRRDLFAMAPLLHTSGPGYVALSDSMLVLGDLRSATGQPRTQNAEVLLARSVVNNLSGQQLSHETFTEEIEFLRIGERLDVDLRPRPTVRATLGDLPTSFSADDLDYRDVVRTAARRMAGLLRALSGPTQWPPTIRLSGGYDSRTCLAAARAAHVERDIRIISHNDLEVHAVDFAIATTIAARLGLTLNPPGAVSQEPAARQLDCTPFTLWSVSNLGVYDYYSLRTSSRSTRRVLEVAGLGAELTKGSFEWQSWTSLCDQHDLDPGVRAALDAQGRRALTDLGCDPEAPDASEWHNLAYRNALHVSRHLPVHISGLAPLQQRQLVAMGRSAKSDFPRPAPNSPSMVNDLSIVLDPALSLLAYDQTGKGLTLSFVESRLARLGGPVWLTDADDFRVLGSLASIPGGPSDFSIRVAEAAGLAQDLDARTIIKLSRQGLDVLDDPSIRDVYAKVHDNAVWRLTKKQLPPVGSGSSPAKLPAILALFS